MERGASNTASKGREKTRKRWLVPLSKRLECFVPGGRSESDMFAMIPTKLAAPGLKVTQIRSGGAREQIMRQQAAERSRQ